jgi:3-oxoacyl-[acyl-carrier protein] reductase
MKGPTFHNMDNPMNGKLAGRTALVTGAGDGMGLAHAALLASLGADVIALDIDAAGAERACEAVREAGRKAYPVVCDVSDAAALTAAVTRTGDTAGGVDILVNNAGYGQRLETARIGVEDFDRMMGVHVRGSFFCGQAVLPHMQRRRYGKIINISSIWGMTGWPVAPHYCAAKAALLGLTKAWAREFGEWNICVNAVAPGGVLTGTIRKSIPPEALEQKFKEGALGRWAEPVEISHAVAFLASPDSDYVTGQVLSPNGGSVIV